MNFFLSDRVDKWGDKLSSFVSQASEKVKEVASATLNKDTPLEKKLKEATSDKNWGSSSTILLEISKATFDYNEYFIIMKTVWECLADKPSKWRRVFKTLTLLEYLLKNGSEKVVDEVRENLYKIKTLYDFHFTEEGRDKGNGIREKAKIITQLVTDNEFLKSEKEIAKKTREKVVGIGSHGERTGAFPLTFDKTNKNSDFFISGGKYDPYDSSKSKFQSKKDTTKEVEKDKEKDRQRAEKEREKARREREKQRDKELTNKGNDECRNEGKVRKNKEEKERSKTSISSNVVAEEGSKRNRKKDEKRSKEAEEDDDEDKYRFSTRTSTSSSCTSVDSSKDSKQKSRSKQNGNASRSKGLLDLEGKKKNIRNKFASNSSDPFSNDVDWCTFESCKPTKGISNFENNFDLFESFTSDSSVVNSVMNNNINNNMNNNINNNINNMNNNNNMLNFNAQNSIQQQTLPTYNTNMSPYVASPFSNIDFFSFPSNNIPASSTSITSSLSSSIMMQQPVGNLCNTSLTSLSMNKSVSSSAISLPPCNLSNNPFAANISFPTSQNMQTSFGGNQSFLSDINPSLVNFSFSSDSKNVNAANSSSLLNNFSSSLSGNMQNNLTYMNMQQQGQPNLSNMMIQQQQQKSNINSMNMMNNNMSGGGIGYCSGVGGMALASPNNLSIPSMNNNNNSIPLNIMVNKNTNNQMGVSTFGMHNHNNHLLLMNNHNAANALPGMQQNTNLIGGCGGGMINNNNSNAMNMMKMNDIWSMGAAETTNVNTYQQQQNAICNSNNQIPFF